MEYVSTTTASSLGMPLYELSAKDDSDADLVEAAFHELACKLLLTPPSTTPHYMTGLDSSVRLRPQDDSATTKSSPNSSCSC